MTRSWRDLSLEEKTQVLMRQQGTAWFGNWHAARKELSRRSAVARHARAERRKAAQEAAPAAIARYDGPGVVSPTPTAAELADHPANGGCA